MDIFSKDREAFGHIDTTGFLDMRFGNAGFLAPYWERYNNDFLISNATRLSYSYAFGSQSIKDAIVALHNKIGNAVTENRHIIVGCGASQMVQAALYALKRQGATVAAAKAPHFPRFVHYADFVGLQFTTDTASPQNAVIFTTPNNPDAILQDPDSRKFRIIDCCYNWPQYTKNVLKLNQDIVIFSMAKATGHASTRIGWALVKDASVASDMEHFIEIQTCGTSVEAQLMARQILNNQTNMEYDGTCFKHGADKLRGRWTKVKEAFDGLPGIRILNDSGMFIWGKTDGDSSDFFKKMGILSVNGDHFGMNDRNHFRLNVGTDVKTFFAFIEKVLNEKTQVSKEIPVHEGECRVSGNNEEVHNTEQFKGIKETI